MLTNNDLKQIKTLIDPLSTDIKDVKKRVENVELRVNTVAADVGDVKKRVKKIEKTVDVMIDQFDGEIVRTQKRVGIIEDHLNL